MLDSGNKVVFWQDRINTDCVKKSLFNNGVLVGYYHEVPFYHRNAFINSSGKVPSLNSIYRCLHSLAQINLELDNMVIAKAAQEYITQKALGIFNVDEKFMINQIDYAKHLPDDMYWVEKKYEWIGFLDRDVILKIVQKNGCDIKRKKTIDVISAAIEVLMCNNEFITVKLIAETTGEKYKRVCDYIGIFRDDIDKYNISLFGTSVHSEFVKNENTQNIKRVVDEFNIKNKRKIASLIGVHYNTVGNLWNEAFAS